MGGCLSRSKYDVWGLKLSQVLGTHHSERWASKGHSFIHNLTV